MGLFLNLFTRWWFHRVKKAPQIFWNTIHFDWRTFFKWVGWLEPSPCEITFWVTSEQLGDQPKHPKIHLPGNSAGDLFGMVEMWSVRKGWKRDRVLWKVRNWITWGMDFFLVPHFAVFPLYIPSLQLAKPLKMDGWKMNFLLGWPNFKGYVSFREGY